MKPRLFVRLTVFLCSFIFMLVKLMQHIKRNIATAAAADEDFSIFIIFPQRELFTDTL